MLNPGDRFGDYRVLRLLGKGGMGSVFLLENADGVQIAAKILDPATASDREARKRFLREAQLALGVKHPNLVETYDVGEDPETGLCYILMEYVPGGDLAGRIEQKGALPISEALCGIAISTAAKPLFAPEDDEAWRVHLSNLLRNCMADDAERKKRGVRRSFAGYTRAKVQSAAKNRNILLGVMYGKTLGDLLRLGSDMSARSRMLDDPWGSIERDFLFTLLMACPGYASYTFQPNRILQAHQAETERFCRKVDEGVYDMSYAQERHAGSTARKIGFGPLTRNFLGQKEMPGRDDSYAMFFRVRFKLRSCIAALACKSYRARHGKLPDSLDELVPEFLDEVPLDPYDGEKLRWNAEKGYFWTKGRDGDFDGTLEFGSDGKPRWKNKNYRRVQLLDF